MVLDGERHVVPTTGIYGWRSREVLQTTRSSQHVVNGASSVLVNSVGGGILVDLDFEPGVGGNPRRITKDILLQRWINIGGQVRPLRMWGMEPQENSRIVNRPPGVSNRS